jgi:DNA replicative helicase MCM subunit Mcm2 (Cdc46/Mcm family)
MPTFNWKISETVVQDGFLKSLKYYCKAVDGDLSVETEGYWSMKKTYTVTRDCHQTEVVNWLIDETTQEGVNAIKSRLQEQLDNLRNPVSTSLPWAVPTFKVTL